VRLRVVRVKLQRSLERIRSVRPVSLRSMDHARAAVEQRVLRLQANRPLDVLDGLGELPRLERKHPQEPPGVGMPWVSGDDPAVNCPRFLKAPGALKLQPDRQVLRGGIP